MDTAITFYASARFGYGGKQYIARIDGRDAKFTFSRTFIGKKSGKRGEDSEAMVDQAGLYERRNVDAKGRTEDVYTLVWLDGGAAFTWPIEKDVAMAYAKRLDERANANDLAKEVIILESQKLLKEGEALDPDEMVQMRASSAKMLGLDPLEKHPRHVILEARRAFIRRIDTTHAEDVSMKLSDVKTELLVEELKKRGLKVVMPRAPKAVSTRSEALEAVTK